MELAAVRPKHLAGKVIEKKSPATEIEFKESKSGKPTRKKVRTAKQRGNNNNNNKVREKFWKSSS